MSARAPHVPGNGSRVPARLDDRTALLFSRGQQRTGCLGLAAALEQLQPLPPFTKREKCLKFMAAELQDKLGPYLLALTKGKRQVTAVVVTPALATRNSAEPGPYCFEVSCIESREPAGYVPTQLTILRITQHAASRLLQRSGRADLQPALIDELVGLGTLSALLSLGEAMGDDWEVPAAECVFLVPTLTGHFVVAAPGIAVTWVSDTIASAAVHRQIVRARANGRVVIDRASDRPQAADGQDIDLVNEPDLGKAPCRPSTALAEPVA